MFEKILGFIDLFKKPVSLLLNGQPKVASDFGIIVSLAILVFVLIQFSSNDIFTNSNPKVVNLPIIQETRPLIHFKDKLMAFSIQDNNGNGLSSFDPSIFSIEIKNVFETDNIVSRNAIHLCKRTDSGFSNQSYDKLGLGSKNYYCLDDNKFDLEGYFYEDRTTYFTIDLTPCDKTTQSNCKSDQEINDFFKNNTLSLNLILSDLIVDSSNYLAPLLPKYHVENILIDYSFKKQMSLYIKNVLMSSDDGKLFPNLGYFDGIAFDSKESDFISSSMDSNNLPIVQIKIFSAQLSLKVTRAYQKIPEVLANFIGLLGFLTLFGAILSSLEKSLFMTTFTMNYLYSFQNYEPKDNINIDDDEKKKLAIEMNKKNQIEPIQSKDMQKNEVFIEEKQTKLDKDNRLISDSNIEMKPIEKKINELGAEAEIKENENKEEFDEKGKKKKTEIDILDDFKSFQDKKSNIKLNLVEYVLFMMYRIIGCRKGLKRQLFWKAQDIYVKEIDLGVMLKRIQDIEKLKLTLLTPKQITLFNLLAKPMIYIEKEQYLGEKNKGGYKMTEILTNSSKKENLKAAVKYYKENFSESEVNDIDGRLIVLLEQNIHDFKRLNE